MLLFALLLIGYAALIVLACALATVAGRSDRAEEAAARYRDARLAGQGNLVLCPSCLMVVDAPRAGERCASCIARAEPAASWASYASSPT